MKIENSMRKKYLSLIKIKTYLINFIEIAIKRRIGIPVNKKNFKIPSTRCRFVLFFISNTKFI